MAEGNSVSGLKAQLARMKAAASGLREKGDAIMSTAFRAVETVAVAGTLGAIEGYNGGDVSVAGLDLPLAAAGAGYAYTLLSGTKHSEHTEAMSAAALAVASYKGGKRLGEKAKKNKTEKGSIFGQEPNQLPEGTRFYGGAPVQQTMAVQGLSLGPTVTVTRLQDCKH